MSEQKKSNWGKALGNGLEAIGIALAILAMAWCTVERYGCETLITDGEEVIVCTQFSQAPRILTK